MISYGLGKPMTLWAQPSTSHSTHVYTASWRALEVPNTRAAERAKWVCLSLGHPYDPTVPCHIYFQPSASSSSPSAGEEDYCPILHGFQGPIVLNVAGSSHVHVRAVNVDDVQVHLAAVEDESRSRHLGELRAPILIAADSVSEVVTTGANQATAVPNTANGEQAKWVLVHWDAPDQDLHWAPVAVNQSWGPILSGRAHNPLLVDMSGFSVARARLVSGADTRIRYTPVENE